jgi:hypothetical protein
VPAGTGLAAYKRLEPLVEDALMAPEQDVAAVASEES